MTINQARKAHRPLWALGVDPEVEIRVTPQQWADAVVHFQIEQPLKEARILIEQQAPVRIACQIIVPVEQVFGEGVGIQGIASVVLLAHVLEGHGQPRLAGAVVGVENDVGGGDRDVDLTGGDVLAVLEGAGGGLGVALHTLDVVRPNLGDGRAGGVHGAAGVGGAEGHNDVAAGGLIAVAGGVTVGGRLLLAAGDQSENHCQCEDQRQYFFHADIFLSKIIYPACAEYDKKVKFSVPARNREKTTWSFSRTPHPRAVCLVRSQLIHFLWTDYNSFILVLSSLSQAYFPVFSMKFSGHCHSAQKCFFLFVLLDTFFFCFFSKIQISP